LPIYFYFSITLLNETKGSNNYFIANYNTVECDNNTIFYRH